MAIRQVRHNDYITAVYSTSKNRPSSWGDAVGYLNLPLERNRLDVDPTIYARNSKTGQDAANQEKESPRNHDDKQRGLRVALGLVGG